MTSSQKNSQSSVQLLVQLLQARRGEIPQLAKEVVKPSLIEALELAAAHRVAPALFDGVVRLAQDEPSWSDTLPLFQTIQAENAKCNQQLYDAVKRINEQLSSLNIGTVFLKGAAFLLEHENYAPWRQLTDLDILVEQADVPKLTSSLVGLGYREKYDYSDVESGLHHHYPPLYNESSNTFVEVHIRLMQDPKENLLSTIEIFDQTKPIDRDGQTFLIPRPEHRMIHLIAHAQIANWGYPLRQLLIKDLVDAAELCRLHYIDWNIVQNAFTKIGAPKALMGFLWAMHITMGIDLPFRRNGGELWAREAIHALHMPPARLRGSARILGQYIRLFSRNPRRLKLVWQTFNNRGQLERLLSVTKKRIRRLD